MPQMSPLSWLTLFLIFSFTFILFNLLNYFNYIPISKKINFMNKMMEKKKLNWKW